MTAIDGLAVAAVLRERVKHRVGALRFQPGLAVILVGDDPASAVYVRNKDRAARGAGLTVNTFGCPPKRPKPTCCA